MKLCGEFVLRKIMGDYIIVPIQSGDAQFGGLITLNESGAFLWQELGTAKDPQDLSRRLQEEYEVGPEEAARDVDQFLTRLKELGILEEM